MRLYSTSVGIAREDEPGWLSLLDLPYCELGELLRSGHWSALKSAKSVQTAALSHVQLRAPIARPGKVPIVGLNYQSHADEAIAALAKIGRDLALPTEPNFHLTPGSAVCGPGDEIQLPSSAPTSVDYEGEIAVVIAERASHVSRSAGWRHVAGLTIVNDVTARDVQRRAMTGDVTVSISQAKSFDTFKPMGPCLVTSDEFTEPLELRLRTEVNGELRQDSSTSEFIYQISELVSYISSFMTLEPGDVVCTGSPQGTGYHSGKFLVPGDRVDITVEGIGTLSNTVRAAQQPTRLKAATNTRHR